MYVRYRQNKNTSPESKVRKNKTTRQKWERRDKALKPASATFGGLVISKRPSQAAKQPNQPSFKGIL